jgi:hypothetical protein
MPKSPHPNPLPEGEGTRRIQQNRLSGSWMTIEKRIQILTWTTHIVWLGIAVCLLPNVAWLFLAEILVGWAIDEKTLTWLLVGICLLIIIPIAYFFTVRRLQWNLPPEDHIVDRMNIKISHKQ